MVTACAEFPDRGGGGVSVSGEFPERSSRRATPVSADGQYTVRRGDSLYSIAWRHGLDYRKVARWNDISPPYVIHPGDEIRLTPPPQRRSAQTQPKQASETQEQASKSGSASPEPSPAPEAAAPADDELRWQWPTSGRVTREFSNNRSGKRGIQLTGEAGQPVRAAAGGRVVYSGNGLRGYGNLIIIKHNSRYLTAYGYNRELLVDEGAQVEAGQRIALMGPGPDNGPALHFELRRDGKAVDPASVLPAR